MARVLVVDDSATMRKIIIKGLREAGFGDLEFAEAVDGASALEDQAWGGVAMWAIGGAIDMAAVLAVVARVMAGGGSIDSLRRRQLS